MPAVPGAADHSSGPPATRPPRGAEFGGAPIAAQSPESRAPAPPATTPADTRTRPGLLRSWRSAVFAPVGDGQRRRRGSDGVRLASAVAALVFCLLVIRYDSRIDRAITQVIHPPPWSITWLVTVVYDGRLVRRDLSCLVALALIARRWVVARDIALSAAGAAAASGILVAMLGSRGGRPPGVVIDGYDVSFPVLQIALFMAVATAALPYLARGVQRLVEIFIALVALASAVGGHGLPLNVVGSLAIGWGAAMTVRLVFGSPLGLPSTDDVSLLLQELGIGASDVRPVTRQVWGVAKYQATETEPGRFTRPAARHRGLRPGRGRRQAAHQGRPVPAVPGLRADLHDYPAAAGRARGLPHLAGRPGGCRRAGARRGGNRGTGQGRAAGLPRCPQARRWPRLTPRTSVTPALDEPLPPAADPAPGADRARRHQR